VPFDHKTHAKMAAMWDGCTTCHHRSPETTTRATVATTLPVDLHTQESSAVVPACKSCHAIPADKVAVESVDIRMPSLKGAYHRQCLNCHREWMHGNACVICHKTLESVAGVKPATQVAPTKDDIVGRMHPPLPEPEIKTYTARFTPAVGGKVIFRHEEHTATFGVKCAHCHRKDNCAHCHDPQMTTTRTAAQKPMHVGRTWKESHEPCVGCHQGDRCNHCHYKNGELPPKEFLHEAMGQQLDQDHAGLACGKCHPIPKFNATPTCGGRECHKRTIAFPAERPGKVVAKLALSTTRAMLATTQPVDGVRKIRR
jgi:hypothetical protein